MSGRVNVKKMGVEWERRALQTALFVAALAVATASYMFNAWSRNTSLTWFISFGAVLVVLVLASLVCLDIWLLSPADSHTIVTLLSQYAVIVTIRIMVAVNRPFYTQLTKNPAKYNIESLMKILRLNQDTDYGREYRFREIHTLADFKKRHPITTETHYRMYIQKMMDGEKNILYNDETIVYASTSGTTGQPKVFPLRKTYIRQLRKALGLRHMRLLSMLNLKRNFIFHMFSQMRKTKGGKPLGAGAQTARGFPKHNLIPVEYQNLVDERSSFYAMALFSLAEPELGYISSFSADLTNSFVKFMMMNWSDLCDDIERGRVGSVVTMSEDVRIALSSKLKSDPERADYLRKAMEDGPVGLFRRVWPTMDYILMSKSAGFKMLADQLMERQMKGVKVVGSLHGATEGFTGVNMEEEPWVGETFTLYPAFCFMEFIRLEDVEEDAPDTVNIDQLEVGQFYEVVHTNLNGLYRCRYGDVIKIVGFDNRLPKYQFMYRLGQRLNIAYERTPEKFLYEALDKATTKLHLKDGMANYTTTESTVTDQILGRETQGHYVYFVEFNEVKDQELLSDLGEKIDGQLVEIYAPYKRFKDVGNIAVVEVIQVEPGTFESMVPILMGARVNSNFKLPRVLRKTPGIKHLLDNTVPATSHLNNQQ